MSNLLNCFALVDDKENLIRRIQLNGNLQKNLSVFFYKQKEEFLREKDLINFDANYKPDRNELFVISDYPINEIFSNCISNPIGCDTLNLNNTDFKIKAIFAGFKENDSLLVLFQVFDTRKILEKGFTLLNSNNTFTKLEYPGIILQENLSAVFDEKKLYFSSYFIAKRFLDLSNYYAEATDAELDQFGENDLIDIEDIEFFKEISDSVIRRKIAVILNSKSLENVTITEIKTEASNYNIEMPTKNGKIVIPTDKKKLKDIISFLEEDFFTTPLTKRKCRTNSKIVLGR